MQSHYPQAATASTNVRPGPGSIPDLGAHTSQMGLPGPILQASLPLYQPSGSLGSWGSSPPPPTTNVNGLAMPMYWQGYYGAPGFPAQQQSLLRPPPGLSMPPSMQQTLQYPATSASLPSGSSNLPTSPLLDSASPLLPPFSLGTLNPQSSLLPAQSSAIVPDSSTTLITNKASAQSRSTATLSTSLPFVSPLTTGLDKAAISSLVSDKPKVPSPVMPFTSMSESVTPIAGTPSSILNEGATPSLVTPGQLLQPGPGSSSQPSQTAQRDVQVVQVSSSELSPSIAATEAQEPILPLPSPFDHKVFVSQFMVEIFRLCFN
jgi:protein LSM14